jgi:hypothetical protein
MGVLNVRARLAIALTAAAVPIVVAEAPGGVVHAATASVSCDAAPPGGALPDRSLDSYEAITPQRLVDTRDGTGGVAAPVGAGCTLRIDLDTTVVPVAATAVSLSVTGIAAQAGYLTVYPCAAGLPDTSNVNPRAGFPTPNLVVGTPDANRELCIFSLAETDVLVDLAGWWEPGPDRFRSVVPTRVIDTRDAAPGAVPANTETAVVVTGDDAGADVPTGATAAVVNLTVTDTSADGYLVAYPCGTDAPTASNLNFRGGESRAVSAIVGLAADGAMCLLSNVATEVIVDVNGYYGPAPQFGPAAALHPLAGERIASSRDGIGGWTGPFTAGTTRSLDPVASLAFAPEATAVTVNVTALNAQAPGFATVYPCGATRPGVSSVNVAPGSVATNLVTVDLARDRTLCFYTSTGVDLIVDLFGVMAAPTGSLAERLSFDGIAWPPFTPTATDYAVECGTDGEETIDLETVAAVTARVNGVVVDPARIPLAADVDQLVTVDLRRGAERVVYSFRCLPPDFPRLTVTRSGPTTPGWYLTTLWAPAPTPSGFVGFSVILDGNGAPIWYKRTDSVVIDMKLRSDGRLIYTPLLGTAYGVDATRGYRVTSLTGTLVVEHFTVNPGANPVDHHDYVELSNGGRAMVAYPLKTGVNMTAMVDPTYLANEWMVDGVIQEINAAGQLVWSWTVDDHFGYGEVTYPLRFQQYLGAPNGGEVDPWHINSIDRVSDGSGDYVVSMRHLDAIARVDRATGDVDWILGSLPANAPQESGAPRLTIVGDPLGGPRRPHDARMVGDVLTMLDNRTGTGQPARAVAYRIDTNAGTATLLWQISNPTGLSSPGLGSTRVNPDGTVTVNWGGGLQPMFQEFTADGVPLLTISQTGGASYRLVKVPISTFSAGVLRATAGGDAEAP